MNLNFTGVSDPGLVRSYNQDAYYVDSQGRFFIVADGMGGHAGGEEASRITVEEIQNYLLENWYSQQPGKQLLKEALLQANKAILADQQNHPERADMGTTAVVVMLRPQESPCCAHVGDSRLYRFRDAKLEQITQDHTWVARALKTGDILPDEARLHPFRHVLSSCLGREDLHEMSVQPLDLQIGDRLLLCSDGLTEELVDEKIAYYFQENSPLEETAHSLVEAAKAQGGNDNITVVLVAYNEGQ